MISTHRSAAGVGDLLRARLKPLARGLETEKPTYSLELIKQVHRAGPVPIYHLGLPNRIAKP